MSKKKLQLVLDLDETLVNCVPRPDWLSLAEKEQQKYKVYDMESDGFLVIRPHVFTLLNFAFTNCVVSVWTWANKAYADFVVDKLTSGQPSKFANVWSGAHADEALEIYGNGKDLKYLWFNKSHGEMLPCNTILIDDLETNTNNTTNRNNVIQVPAFNLFTERSSKYNNVSNDKTLLNVIDVLRGVINSPKFCRYDTISPFTSLTKVTSSQSGGRRKLRTSRQKRKMGTEESRVLPYKN